jgi:competence protein ComEA
MDEEASIGVRIQEFISKNLLFVILVVMGLVLCIIGGVQYLSSRDSESELKFITNDEPEKVSASITVDVQGQVKKPGVYTLDGAVRLKDAIDAAGGFTSDADNEYISKRLNLAQKISDGVKIYIPSVGEIDTDTSVLGSNSVVETVSQDTPAANSNLVDINTAGIDSLDTLPRIGPVTAQKIIDSRPYGSIEELVSKKVMGQKTFDGLKDRILVQ